MEREAGMWMQKNIVHCNIQFKPTEKTFIKSVNLIYLKNADVQ